MSSSYEQEQQRRAQERKNAPKTCPHCGTPMNEHLSEWERVRSHCGSDKCRKAASRANLAERKRQERNDARARVLAYCDQHLDRDQKHAVMNMCDALMQFSYDEGHQVAEAVVKVIDARRCKHEKITTLEQNALLWQRRAETSERQLKERIRELEEELALFTSLHNAIHGIVTDQLRKQPDQEEPTPAPVSETEPESDTDRVRVLTTLDQAGIKPYTGGQEDEDDTEGGEEEKDKYEGE
jgi:ribosomal protein S27AE